uniref:hypothetical chloroplast RF1 n=1 Tax=Paris fargesii var. macrosepala TaxID=2878549 RepID=UPI0021824FBE|nr:hypothetical chloroplast RF1 [Paris sp. CG-2021b]UVH65994.1 hypothetical chloroplast RF1 [Paris sp. CG-2021b]
MFTQIIRGSMLVTQSFLRKNIVLPLLIIAKNVGRMLLFQFPEWYEDFKALNKEMHINCTYNGVPLSETEFPKDWLADGIQIKILYPFCLKPWRGAKIKVRSGHRDSMKEKKNKNCFLTIWGKEAKVPFGSPRKRFSFFKPISQEIDKTIRKVQNQFSIFIFIFLRFLKERIKWALLISKVIKVIIKVIKVWIIKIAQVRKRIMKELEKITLIFLFLFMKRKVKVYEPNQNGKDFQINNKMNNESTIQIRSMNWTNYSLTEKKRKDLSDRIITIRNQIEQITKDKKKRVQTYDDKRLEYPKYIWQLFKRNNIRLIRKFHYFMKFFIEKIYIDIFLCTINIPRIHAQLFFESKNKILNKSIYNDEINQEGIDETIQNTMNFISTVKKLVSNTNTNISDNNFNSYFDLSSLSQAYVFYKFSQTPLFNKYNLRSVLQDRGTYHYLRGEIKDYCIKRGIFDYKSRHKKMKKSGMNEWKNWLKGHDQYNLSPAKWSRLEPKKWRSRVSRMIKNKDLMKLDSDKKEKIHHYMKENYDAGDSLTNQNKKNKFKKHYGYYFFSHKYMNYGDKTDKNLYIYGSKLQVNGHQEIPYNFNTRKPDLFYVLLNIAVDDFLKERYIIAKDKNLDRKYFHCGIFHFCIRKNIDIETWTNTIETWTNTHVGTKIKKNTKTETHKYHKMKKKDISIHEKINPPTPNQKRNFFDWMGMNQKRFSRNRNILNRTFWLFPEFVLLFDTYKIKPWVIPIKLLLLDLYANEHGSHISSNQKEYLELKNSNQQKNEQQSQIGLGSDLRKKKDVEKHDVKSDVEKEGETKKDVEKHDVKSDVEKEGETKKDVEKHDVKSDVEKEGETKKDVEKHDVKSDVEKEGEKEKEMDLFLKQFFYFQFKWVDPFNQLMFNNLKVYCFLLRLPDINKKILISSVKRREMHMDMILMTNKAIIPELLKKGIFIIKSIRLFIEWDEQFIIYQTISISLADKSENQNETNGKCIKKRDVEKKNFDRSIAQHSNILVNRKKKNSNFLIPENILSTKRRRELRIRILLNSRNWNIVDINPVFFNENKMRNCGQFLNEDRYLNTDVNNININTDVNNILKLKLLLWPNYRLEDLACMNRYWFNTNNGSRFSMLRIHMYPQFRIS